MPTECQDITQNRTLKIWVLINHCIDLLTKTTSILCLCTICFRQKPYQELTVSYINFITQSQAPIEQLLWHSSGEADTTFHFYPVWFSGVVVCFGFFGGLVTITTGYILRTRFFFYRCTPPLMGHIEIFQMASILSSISELLGYDI